MNPQQPVPVGTTVQFGANHMPIPGTAIPPIQPKVSTTTLSNGNKMEQVASNNNVLAQYSNKGITTDNEGNQKYADGSFVTEADTSEEDDQITALLDSMKAQTDANTAAQIANIQSQFNIREQQQAKSNASQNAAVKNALLMGGSTGQGSSSQYAPVSSAGIISAQESYGIQQLAQLDVQENNLIAQARAAQQAGNFQIMEKKLELVQKKRDEKMEAAAKLNEQIAKENEENLKGINNIALEAQRNGASPETVKEIMNSGTISNAIMAAGESLQTASGQLGEYLQYKRDTVAKGLTPYDYTEWKAKEEARQSKLKSNEAYSSAYASAKGKSDAEGESTIPTNDSTVSDDTEKALNLILGSAKFTAEQKKDLKNAVNNGEDPLSVIKNQAKNIAGQTEANKITNFEVAKEQLADIDATLEEFYANGGNTSLFSGKLEKVINKLGEVKNPKLVELATQIQSALQIYRNAVSGTAYSVQEGQDIASIFPGINKSSGLNKSILSGRMKAFDSTIDSSYRSVLGDVYDRLKQSEEVNIDPQISVDKFVIENPDKKQIISNLYKLPGWTDNEVWEYISSQFK